jgi:hypothetical protein
MFILLAILCLASTSTAYVLRSSRINSMQIFGLGDILKGAFANEDIGPAKNAGLSKEPEVVQVEFLPSKKIAKAYLGQKISDIAKANAIAIKYSCKKGIK